ncbi:hypothetical protein KUCAC02_002972 [Chaenocephalus aceratus]|uniref:Uncharacterized protein n=1 Tax=Chaenocephalus aceratus TaxID=36190 RepID=A0ACB9WJ74_CHAAC|nr:hypothetical protein KUCAC02_002972 [Chaenocephalus aceratus]
MNGDGLRGRKTTQTDQDKMDIKQKDGGRQERRGVWCRWKYCLTLTEGSISTSNDEQEGKAVTLQKQGRRRSGTAPHARLVLLTAHQESRTNGHFTPKPSLYAHHRYQTAIITDRSAEGLSLIVLFNAQYIPDVAAVCYGFLSGC